MPNQPHKCFSHNGEDTIYHQKTANSIRFAFLVVSEFFDTPDKNITETLDFIVNALNDDECISHE